MVKNQDMDRKRVHTCKHAHISLCGRIEMVSARHGEHEVEPDLAAACHVSGCK
jgi:hypothetical protein